MTVEEAATQLHGSSEFRQLQQDHPEAALEFENEFMDSHVTPPPTPDGPIRTFVRPVLTGVGGGVGAAIGAATGTLAAPGPGSVAGGITGGILGGAGGAALSDVIEQQFGEQARTQTLQEALTENLPRNLRTGAQEEAFGRGFQLVGKGLVGAKNLITDKLIPPARRRIVEMANQLGFNLSPAEASQSQTLRFVEQALSALPFTGDIMREFDLKQLKFFVDRRKALLAGSGTAQEIEIVGTQIQNQLNAIVALRGLEKVTNKEALRNQILHKLGAEETFEQLSRNAEESFQGVIKRGRKKVDAFFDAARNLVPTDARVLNPRSQKLVQELDEVLSQKDTRLVNSKLAGVVNQLKGSGNPELDEALINLPEGAGPGVAKVRAEAERQAIEQFGERGHDVRVLMDTLDDIKALQAQYSAEQRFGVAGSGSGLDNKTFGQFTKIRDALEDDLQHFFEQTSGDAAHLFRLGRAKSRGIKFVLNDVVAVKKFFKQKPSEALEVLKGADTEEIKVFRSMLKEDFKTIEDFTSRTILGLERTEPLSSDQIRSAINRFGPERVKAILGETNTKSILEFADALDAEDAIPVDNDIFKAILRSDPERVIGKIVKPENISNLLEIEQSLGRNAIKQVKEGFLTNLLKLRETTDAIDPAVGLPEGRIFGLKQFIEKLNSYEPRIINKLFQDDPNGLKELRQIATLAQQTIGFERGAQSGMGIRLISFINNTIMFQMPGQALGLTLKWTGLAKLFTSPTGRKLLLETMELSPSSDLALQNVGRLIGLATTGGDAPSFTKPAVARTNLSDDLLKVPNAKTELSAIGAR